MNAVLNYFREVKGELAKVIWPSVNEVIKLTLIVIVIALVVAIYVGGLDIGLTKLLEITLTK